ncbi:MAG: hypothetical protein OXH15_15270 [Gammaproteobacteria bacterium]|nr:hypothetical protein [Gammaproteobacteria bacterium]
MVQGDGLFLSLLSRWFAAEPEAAAGKIVRLLQSPETAAADGAYFAGTREVGFRAGISAHPGRFDRIWQLSLQLAEMTEWVRRSSRSSAVIAARAARVAGKSPPTTPSADAQTNPRPTKGSSSSKWTRSVKSG